MVQPNVFSISIADLPHYIYECASVCMHQTESPVMFKIHSRILSLQCAAFFILPLWRPYFAGGS